MTYSALTNSVAEMKAALIVELEALGYDYNPLTTSFNQYLATVLVGVGGSTVSHLRMSRTQLLAGIINALDGGPVSHLTSNYAELLALGLGALTTPPDPGTPTGDGSMDFSIATGDNTGLLALLEDI